MEITKINNFIIILLFTALLTGCASVGPDYKKVTPNSPEKWNSEVDATINTKKTDDKSLGKWWAVLNDPLLEDIEKKAVQQNLSLKEGIQRVKEARALLGISKAGFFPTLNAGGSALKYRTSKSSSTGSEYNLFSADIDAGWELDIFGGVRRSVEAAKASLQANEESVHDIMVSLNAEIALNYVNLRTYQARLKAATNNLAAQKHTYDLNQSRYKSGLIDELAVHQSLYNMEETRSQIPLLQSGISLSLNRLCVLIGEKPGTLNYLKKPGKIPAPPISIAIGIPADALRRRPDIRMAEREVAAYTAKIGVAKADLYPRLKLSGSIGLEALEAEDFTNWSSRTFHIGPSFSWNIFDAGAIRRNVDAQDIRQKESITRYKASVLNALEEVENAITDFSKEKERFDALKKATEAAKKADLISKDRYKAGLVDFSNVLDAQRSLSSFQDALAQSTGNVTANMIRLYKALGGGWDYDIESFVKKK